MLCPHRACSSVAPVATKQCDNIPLTSSVCCSINHSNLVQHMNVATPTTRRIISLFSCFVSKKYKVLKFLLQWKEGYAGQWGRCCKMSPEGCFTFCAWQAMMSALVRKSYLITARCSLPSEGTFMVSGVLVFCRISQKLTQMVPLGATGSW